MRQPQTMTDSLLATMTDSLLINTHWYILYYTQPVGSLLSYGAVSYTIKWIYSVPDPSWIQQYSHTTRHPTTLNLLSVQWWEDWCKTFLTTVIHISLLWMTSTRGPSFLGSLPVATLVSLSPGKRWWTNGQNPRKGFNSLFRVDCYQSCWLCAHKHTLIHLTQPEGVCHHTGLSHRQYNAFTQSQILCESDTTPM